MKKSYIIGICIVLILIASVTIFLLSNQSDVSDEKTTNNDQDSVSDMNLSSEMQFHKSINTFGFELLKQFIKNPKYNENPFYSPYSIFTALAMAYEGASGNTADEMAAVLNIQQDNESFHDYVLDLYNTFNNNTAYNLSTANAAWIQQDYLILDEYIQTVEEFYQAEASNIDFSNPSQAANIINQWVENKTNNLIHDLITADAIDPVFTKLILTNAIYFKGTWEIQFEKVNTTNKSFTTSSDETTDVPTMSLTNTTDMFYYTETDEFQMLELPYTGNDLSMMILLPKENNTLSSIINTLSEESYTECLDATRPRQVNLYLPKFNITTPQYSLRDMLSTLGIHDAFSINANFSGMTGNKELNIKQVFHKGFISVNEEGTEAAAATGTVMVFSMHSGRITFNCDHPFLYLIQHKQTGTILFMGTMNNPNA